MTTFKIGDVVALKSGGPAMTVEHLQERGYVGCTWFDEKKRIQGTFQRETLRGVPPEENDGE